MQPLLALECSITEDAFGIDADDMKQNSPDIHSHKNFPFPMSCRPLFYDLRIVIPNQVEDLIKEMRLFVAFA